MKSWCRIVTFRWRRSSRSWSSWRPSADIAVGREWWWGRSSRVKCIFKFGFAFYHHLLSYLLLPLIRVGLRTNLNGRYIDIYIRRDRGTNLNLLPWCLATTSSHWNNSAELCFDEVWYYLPVNHSVQLWTKERYGDQCLRCSHPRSELASANGFFLRPSLTLHIWNKTWDFLQIILAAFHHTLNLLLNTRYIVDHDGN